MNTKVVPNPEQKGWEENGATTDGTPIYKWESGGVSGNGSGTGAGMVISPTPPTDKVTGMQWLNSTTAEVFIWDEDKWVEMPAGSGGDLWTDNGGNSISYDGNVGINANSETPLTIGKAGTTALWEWDLQAGAVDSIRLSAKNPSGGYYAQDALVVDSGGTVTVNGELLAAKADAGASALAIGDRAGKETQGPYTVALGIRSGETGQGESAVGVGNGSGRDNQGDFAIAVGKSAGLSDQSVSAVAVGAWAGESSQGAEAVAVGKKAGQTSQGDYATALGDGAGKTDQGAYSTAVGVNAGENNQGSSSIAIGFEAAKTNQGANGIVISSFGSAVDVNAANHIQLRSPTGSLRYNGSDSWEFFGGSVSGISFRQAGVPVIDAKGLISTLLTLRRATMDETQDIRESLRLAIDELVAEFEQEIAAMPAGDSE